MQAEPNNLGELIHNLYLSGEIALCAAETFQEVIMNHGDRSLFVLDGLDEVSYELDPDAHMGRIL